MNENERKALFRKTFDTVAENYDNPALRFFVESVPPLVTCLGLSGSERVLDVATGTGNTALALAGHVPGGQVYGIDFSAGMLAKADEKKKMLGIDNVQFIQMDMTSLQFPDDHFHRVVCSFGLFFIDDMVEQLNHMAKKTKPEGRIAVTTFGENLFSPQVTLFLERIERYGVEIPPMTWKRTDAVSKCSALFDAAGLTDIRCFKKDQGYYLSPPERWWDILWNAGYRGLLRQLSEEDLDRFKQEHLAEVVAIADEKGLWLDIQFIYTSGTKSPVVTKEIAP